MDLPETVAAWTAASAVLLTGIVLDRRPYAPGKRNYVPLLMIALIVWMVLSAHLARLLFVGR